MSAAVGEDLGELGEAGGKEHCRAFGVEFACPVGGVGCRQRLGVDLLLFREARNEHWPGCEGGSGKR